MINPEQLPPNSAELEFSLDLVPHLRRQISEHQTARLVRVRINDKPLTPFEPGAKLLPVAQGNVPIFCSFESDLLPIPAVGSLGVLEVFTPQGIPEFHIC